MTRSAPQMRTTAEALHWLPEEAVHYLKHTSMGRSIRDIARSAGCHASTVSRRIRRYENRRDDPLVDGALDRYGAKSFINTLHDAKEKDTTYMTATSHTQFVPSDSLNLSRDMRRVLRRLAETGAVLAVAQEMDKAVVVRDLPGGQSTRTAVVDREVAEVMALNEWIHCPKPGRIARYSITAVGRAALKRMLAGQMEPGLAETAQPFIDQPADWARPSKRPSSRHTQKVSYTIAESPLTALARRKDKTGAPFLDDELLAAGERLREDFELAQMGPDATQNWERFLTTKDDAPAQNEGDPVEASRDARRRVSGALSDLGPGLGDVVLRCCCFLEGIESTERKMGWSARSGKIVLRIALQRLKRHYDETNGKFGPLIG